MKLLIDDANFDKIKRLYEFYPIDGVTTNPTILAKSGRQPYDVLTEIRNFIGADADLHVQAVSRTADRMVEEGHKIAVVLGKNTYIKIPAIPEGLKAIRILSGEGYHVTATAIYTIQQAFLAGKAGADFAAPYVNRIDNLGADGILYTKRIHDVFKKNGLKTELLAASFKNTQQVLELAEYGIGAATVGADVIDGLIKNPTVMAAIEAFIKDFEGLCGAGKDMTNC